MSDYNEIESRSNIRSSKGSEPRDTQLRLAVLIGNLHNVVLYETGGGREYVTQNIFNLLGYPPEKFTTDRNFFPTLIHPEDTAGLDMKTKEWLRNGSEETLKLEFRCKKSSGEYIWLEDNMNYINPPGENYYFTGVLIDITDRKESEQTIKDSLKEKEILLKEIHHRVKNNLQVISSLLKIQSFHTESAANKEIFEEIQNRIRSMAMIHHLIYKSDSISRISFGEYMHELLKSIRENHPYANISFFPISDPIPLNIEIAVPCGLLINELISILIKNLETQRERDLILVNLKRDEQNTGNIILSVIVENDRLPGELIKQGSMGEQLIGTLLEQIDASLEIDKSSGNKYTITFKESQYIERLP